MQKCILMMKFYRDATIPCMNLILGGNLIGGDTSLHDI